MAGDEEVFEGGVNRVRRVGATVVRPAGLHTRSVHRLLRHIRGRGFMGGPEVLALDLAQGTETLSFLPGEVGVYPIGARFRTDEALVSAARLLRDYHDATADFEVASSDHWFVPPRDPAEVICHGDYAPYNCVNEGGETTGVFDFDTAHPGPRLWDVGYGAYRWAPLTSTANLDGFGDLSEQGRRLRLFCEAYGTDELREVVEMAAERLVALVEMMRRLASNGHEAFGRHVEGGHDELYLRDVEYLRGNAETLAWAES